MPNVRYPDETKFAFAPGVTCLTTPAGAVLLNPPRNERLTALTAGQLRALRTLNVGSATKTDLSGPRDTSDVAALLDRLVAGGWLAVTVRTDGKDLYSLQPFGQPPPRPGQSSKSNVMSKFAVLQRNLDAFLLQHPLSWCDLQIHDTQLLVVLDGLHTRVSDSSHPAAAQLVEDLRWSGILVARGDEDSRFEVVSWSAPDLWFHRRSTLGQRTVTWEHFGPTKWAKGRFAQPPARRAKYPGELLALPVPDLTAQDSREPSLTNVIESRVSTRAFDDGHPISVEQLAELLYRTARTRSIEPVGEGEELLSRPYPSGGSLYELEVYPIVRNVAGLEPGMYHYDSFDHSLCTIAATDSRAVHQLLKTASATLSEGAEPQVLIVMAARSGRIMWTYEQVSYATILKNVGALMQTMYLVATAMGLGVCAQGFSDTAAFVAATGVDELEECSVGSIIVGLPAQSRPPSRP
ncbi:SagB family peptide dehydrogenase [Mycobacterium sp.]|uniref:SagB family peptide dehydrogenase n=1 Tax=Mycobacterium sp. TaxID=1785 RepID=UPI0025E2B51F|nr:SagB family peptide dehydrogenase [Mycobacterium sp.]